jgi:RsiW-degrading membrane proteinase PrsW (M82 family)
VTTMPSGSIIVWKGALKNAVSTVSGAILANIIDPQTMVFSLSWLRHITTVCIAMLVINEARYWKTWADKPDDNHPVVLSFFWTFFVSLAFQLSLRWAHLP